MILLLLLLTTWRWSSRFKHCAKSRKFADSIPDWVIGIFHLPNPSGRDMTQVDSASNKNEYREYLLGIKAAEV